MERKLPCSSAVERVTVNHSVVGSSPTGGAINFLKPCKFNDLQGFFFACFGAGNVKNHGKIAINADQISFFDSVLA